MDEERITAALEEAREEFDANLDDPAAEKAYRQACWNAIRQAVKESSPKA